VPPQPNSPGDNVNNRKSSRRCTDPTQRQYGSAACLHLRPSAEANGQRKVANWINAAESAARVCDSYSLEKLTEHATRFWRRARGPKFNFLCSLFKQNNVERGGVSGLPELPPTLHRSSHFTMSALESSSTGSSFPAVLAKSVPLAAASLDSE